MRHIFRYGLRTQVRIINFHCANPQCKLHASIKSSWHVLVSHGQTLSMWASQRFKGLEQFMNLKKF